jgi:TPP-dependent pyruvate/acetoin dehydrogenase alpha subunit
MKRALGERGVLTEEAAAALDREVQAAVEDAVAFAKSSPEPSVDQLMTDIYA